MERENQCSKRSDVLPKDKRTRIGVLTVREHCKIFIFLQNIVKLHDIARIPWQIFFYFLRNIVKLHDITRIPWQNRGKLFFIFYKIF